MGDEMLRGLIATAVLAGALSFGVAAPAHADCLTVPDLPDECLTQATYDYITDLQGDRDRISDNLVKMADYAAGLASYNLQLRDDLWQAGLDRQAAEQQASMARAERDIALEELQHKSNLVTALRAKVKYLRGVLRDIRG